MKKIWKISVVVTLAVMAFSGCGKAEAFAYKQFDNIQFTCALEEGAGQGISVGGQTGMRIQEDGSFSASYYAMDTEDTGEDYQGGTMYYGSAGYRCNDNGSDVTALRPYKKYNRRRCWKSD